MPARPGCWLMSSSCGSAQRPLHGAAAAALLLIPSYPVPAFHSWLPRPWSCFLAASCPLCSPSSLGPCCFSPSWQSWHPGPGAGLCRGPSRGRLLIGWSPGGVLPRLLGSLLHGAPALERGALCKALHLSRPQFSCPCPGLLLWVCTAPSTRSLLQPCLHWGAVFQLSPPWLG